MVGWIVIYISIYIFEIILTQTFSPIPGTNRTTRRSGYVMIHVIWKHAIPVKVDADDMIRHVLHYPGDKCQCVEKCLKSCD